MAQDHYKETVAEELAKKARRVWYRQRVEAIHAKVTTYDVLRSNGVDLKQSGDAEPEQFSCPFHGVDTRPSARVYPEDAANRSHAWCFVCQERWDAITLYAKFNQLEEKPFGQMLSSMEKSYGLETPPLPSEAVFDEKGRRQDALWETFLTLYNVCERRLCDSYPSFKYLDDRIGYLKLGSALDKLRHRAKNRSIDPEQAQSLLRRVLTKIQEKERKCPTG